MYDNYCNYVTKTLMQINGLRCELSRLKTCYIDLLDISSMDISDRVKTTETNKVVSFTEERALKRLEIENRIKYLEDKISTFEKSIDKLPETQGKLLTMRFIEGHKIMNIANITGYNYDYVRKVIRKASYRLTEIILKDIIDFDSSNK